MFSANKLAMIEREAYQQDAIANELAKFKNISGPVGQPLADVMAERVLKHIAEQKAEKKNKKGEEKKAG